MQVQYVLVTCVHGVCAHYDHVNRVQSWINLWSHHSFIPNTSYQTMCPYMASLHSGVKLGIQQQQQSNELVKCMLQCNCKRPANVTTNVMVELLHADCRNILPTGPHTHTHCCRLQKCSCNVTIFVVGSYCRGGNLVLAAPPPSS